MVSSVIQSSGDVFGLIIRYGFTTALGSAPACLISLIPAWHELQDEMGQSSLGQGLSGERFFLRVLGPTAPVF